MTTPAKILRELSAETRTFRTVQGALLWVADERARLTAMAQPPIGTGVAPRNQAEIDKAIATFASIVWSLHDARKQLDERCWKHIYEWQRGWTQHTSLFPEWGFKSFHEMRKEMRKTERKLKEIFTAHGILEAS